jgi:hypothetical protein
VNRNQASLVLNVLLAVTVLALALHKSNDAPTIKAANAGVTEMTNEISSAAMTNKPQVFAKPQKAARAPDFNSPSERRRWIIDQLRAMGAPNDVLALVALEDFEAQWDNRFEECWGDMDKMGAIQLAKDLSKDAEMRAALGEDGFKQWDTKNMLWEAMSTAVDVTPSEAETIRGLKKKLQQRQLEVEQGRLNGTIDRAGMSDAVNKAYAEYNHELKTVLGDERYAKSQQLDDAFTSDNLRYQLAKANPNESQFQELFKIEKDWNKSLSGLDPDSLDYLEKFKALNEARDRDYERILGSDAVQTLRKQEDTSYTQMKKYENLWGLDDGKIDYVYDAMKQYRKRVGDYQIEVRARQAQGERVDWDAVNGNLQQLAGQTQRALQNYVGDASFDRLRRNGVLRWAGAGFQPIRSSAAK